MLMRRTPGPCNLLLLLFCLSEVAVRLSTVALFGAGYKGFVLVYFGLQVRIRVGAHGSVLAFFSPPPNEWSSHILSCFHLLVSFNQPLHWIDEAVSVVANTFVLFAPVFVPGASQS